jgi:hypothetical protein
MPLYSTLLDKVCGLHIGHETLEELPHPKLESLERKFRNSSWKMKHFIKRHKKSFSSLDPSLYGFRGQCSVTSQSRTDDVWSIAAMDGNIATAEGLRVTNSEALYCGHLIKR